MNIFDEIIDSYRDYVNVYKRFNVEKIIPLEGGSDGESRYLLLSGKNKYLLSDSDMNLWGRRFVQYYCWRDIAHLHINMPKILHKNCQDDHNGEVKVLCVFTYVEGCPISEYLRRANRYEAYRIGVRVGNMVKEIHAVEVDYHMHHQSPWLRRYEYVQRNALEAYRPHPLTDTFLQYYTEHSDTLKKYNSTVHYTYFDGGYKKDNLIVFVTNELTLDNLVICDGELGLKNISGIDVCDPMYEFRFMASFALCNEYFATGVIDGYFDGEIPEDFFGILKYYTCEYVISEFGKTLTEHDVNGILEFYGHMKEEIPKWYQREADLR